MGITGISALISRMIIDLVVRDLARNFVDRIGHRPHRVSQEER